MTSVWVLGILVSYFWTSINATPYTWSIFSKTPTPFFHSSRFLSVISFMKNFYHTHTLTPSPGKTNYTYSSSPSLSFQNTTSNSGINVVDLLNCANFEARDHALLINYDFVLWYLSHNSYSMNICWRCWIKKPLWLLIPNIYIMKESLLQYSIEMFIHPVLEDLFMFFISFHLISIG